MFPNLDEYIENVAVEFFDRNHTKRAMTLAISWHWIVILIICITIYM